MGQHNELTGTGSSLIVQLIIYRLRESQCGCDLLNKAAIEMDCSRCRIIERMKNEFPTEYFAACELITRRPRGTK